MSLSLSLPLPCGLCALLVILLVHLSASAPPTLVPQIRTNGFQLEPLENTYYLSIQHPDGTIRRESVKEIAPGLLQVEGVINQPFEELGTSLVVTYRAGPDGYVAKYTYGKGPPTPPPQLPQFLSPNALKSSVG
ncbi:uncharacterized protein DMAD_04249 [Drosophila madeirensis]|uniref:Cuticular protein n=1 Tax=Drosophila madeirensis TaxID=30013 RepID=A0AAU9GD35_DROMD|nr:uncharacterized protein LOC117890368 [Drosophila subobscura]